MMVLGRGTIPRSIKLSHCGKRWNSTSSSEVLQRTGLYELHVAQGAKMVPFAGYSMPLSYGSIGQIASHHHVRQKAGLFDVGHMVQTIFRGPSAGQFLQTLTPSALTPLKPFSSTLSVLLNENGGIIDDCIITKQSSETYYVVTNAGRRDRDLSWFRSNLHEDVDMHVLADWGLVALQGPYAMKVLQQFTKFDLKELLFGTSYFIPFGGIEPKLHVARSGYTGEDGFEISIPPKHTLAFTEMLLGNKDVQLVGLGARDSLRLEAGMCLYGQDLDEEIGPVEAGLSWVIGKERRDPDSPLSSFIGNEKVLQTLKEGPGKRRVGLIVEGAPARHGAKIFSGFPNESNKEIGLVTSGIPSPTLGQNIAMGYVSTEKAATSGKGYHVKHSPVLVEVRGKLREGKIVGLPFVEAKYYRG